MQIGLTQLWLLPRPLYVLVAGGIACGKSHMVRKLLPDLPIMDVDHVMEAHGWTDYEGPQLEDAGALLLPLIEGHLQARRSFIAMSTSANLAFSIYRLHRAQQFGFRTLLLHIDAPLEQALAQNQERKNHGQRFVVKDLLPKIAQTTIKARENYQRLIDTGLVHYHASYWNARKEMP